MPSLVYLISKTANSLLVQAHHALVTAGARAVFELFQHYCQRPAAVF